jgi:Flp pilus assembly secretin CpaC
MRYLAFLAAVLASAPACAAESSEFTDRIELRPGVAERWLAPRAFKAVVPGNPDIVDIVPGQTDREIIIIKKPDSGTTNIVLIDETGKQVANLLVAGLKPDYEAARSGNTGALLYRKDPECAPDCLRVPKPK